jgi:hypothetical protein
VYEVPKSPWIIPVTQVKYRDNLFWSNPSSALKAAIVSSCALMPSMNDAGSPGAISTTAKIIIEARHRLIINEIALLRIYLSISNYLEK